MAFYFALAALLGAVAAAPHSARAQQTWTEYKPEGAGYRVEMPGTWKITSQDVAADAGAVKMHMATVDEATKVYMATHSVFTRDDVNRTPADRILDNARDGAVKNVKGKLLSEKTLKIGGAPARHIVVDAPPARVSQRIWLSGANLVQAIFVGPAGAEKERVVSRFFDSLGVAGP